jgi:hypothetical protein
VAWSGCSPHTGLASDQVDDVSVCLRWVFGATADHG